MGQSTEVLKNKRVCIYADRQINSKEHGDFLSQLPKHFRTYARQILIGTLKNSPEYKHHIFDESNCPLILKIADSLKATDRNMF